MKLKTLYFLPILCTIFLFSPVHAWAFFSDSKITLVQEGNFPQGGTDNRSIENILDSYTFCKDGDWDTFTNNDGEDIVSYQCTYNTQEAVKSHLRDLHIQDPEIAQRMLSALKDSQFSLDLLLTFTVNADKNYYKLNEISYLYKGENQTNSTAQTTFQLENILKNKPITLPILSEQGKAGKIFAYTLDKILLGEESIYNYRAPFYENLGFSYNIKHSPILTARLSNLQFDNTLMQIKGTLALTLQVPAKKIDVTKEKGYFIKHFKAALGASPQILQSQTFTVFLRKNTTNPTHFSFEDADKTFLISFDKKKLAPLASKDIKASFKGEVKQEVKDFIRKNAEISNIPQGVAHGFLGNYVYESEGMKGSVRIRQDNTIPNNVHVFLNTVNVQALHLCEYEGSCTLTENKYICPIKDAPEGMEAVVEIVPTDRGFKIPQNPSLLCGVRGFMSGDYTRCTAETSGPLTMVVVPMEIIHEDTTFIVRFNDDGAESLEFITQKQAEFLENMIGKNVLVHYNQNQIWNAEKKFCNRSKEILTVEDATKPEAKLLGGYSHANSNLKGYAFIEPDFTSKSAFNIHLNNYSNTLDKNCQFAGDCYAEGTGFICNTFDKEQNPEEYFELIPVDKGFLVLNNPTNTCTYEGFMSGKYEKCDNKIFESSSMSAKLQEVNEEDFMFTHVILKSDNKEIPMRIGIDQSALAKSLVGKDVFVSFVDEQYWGEHDRACVREKRVTRIQTLSAIKNSLIGNYIHNAKGISGSAVISEVENMPDAFNLTLKNLGLTSKASCPFSGICTPQGKGYICKPLSDKEKTTITVIPTDHGFDIPLDITSPCKMRSLQAGNYSKCVKKTLGTSSVTGVLEKIEENNDGQVELIITIKGSAQSISLAKDAHDFSTQLALIKSFMGKNITIGYTEEQNWHTQEKLCKRSRIFTSITAVKPQQKP